ncbi:hypothetical protein C8T65DRAFT_584494 [Cerioporus squamosus]|nr:hypothetical protein C8T65DRAFT_584494 [Cerioporus squamosus]
MEWVQYHHSSFVNATVACTIRLQKTTRKGASFSDLIFSHFLQISVAYRNDPDLPIEQRFELCGIRFAEEADPRSRAMVPFLQVGWSGAYYMGTIEYGRAYAGTGSYLVVARFGPSDLSTYAGQDGIPFVEHFSVDLDHARAKLACRHPMRQLKEDVALGKKMRFQCCGWSPKDDTCCCGGSGWTHEPMGV